MGFGAAVTFGDADGIRRSTNLLKQISRSSSSFRKRQSVTIFAGAGFAFCSGGTIAS